MNDTQRARFEGQILAERSRLEEVLERLARQAGESPADRGRFADDAGYSSAGASADDDRALMTHTTRELAELDEALRQLRDDPAHFGRCATCGTSIPFERLRLVPGTRHCVAHAPL
jgi:RNA polymerase-binding transcription factor DksA